METLDQVKQKIIEIESTPPTEPWVDIRYEEYPNLLRWFYINTTDSRYGAADATSTFRPDIVKFYHTLPNKEALDNQAYLECVVTLGRDPSLTEEVRRLLSIGTHVNKSTYDELVQRSNRNPNFQYPTRKVLKLIMAAYTRQKDNVNSILQ